MAQRFLTQKIRIQAPTTAATYGEIVDISMFASLSLCSDGTAFVGSYAPAFYQDLADPTSTNYTAGLSGITAPNNHQDVNLGGVGHGHFRGLRLYCQSYTSGTPTFWIVGRYLS